MANRKITLIMMGLILICSCYALSTAGAEDNPVKAAPADAGGKRITLHYTLTVDGKVVDSSEGREPLKFQVGSSQVIPGFEKAVKDMKAGEKKSFDVSPEEGYGQEDPAAIQAVPKDKLPSDIKPEPGMTLYAKGVDGHPVPVKIVEVKDDVVLMNFNHPLAGKTLHFDVEIVDVL